ncbi:CHASE3 domain-containing protein [Tateyamaria sp.]|uniref:CHASE3 domain-containing protein n=1 Tax=Tateyamaria sp. TaxID=1929288 RepID=UPI00329B42FA
MLAASKKCAFSLSNIDTKTKVLVSAAAPLILALVIGSIALINLERMKQTQGWVDQTQQVLADATGIVAAAMDMEAGMRGFLVTGDEAFLELFNVARDVFDQSMAELAKRVDDTPPQAAILIEAKDTIEAWLVNVVTPMRDLRREIGDADTMDDMADLVGQARGQQHFHAFRALMAEFSAIEDASMAIRRAENARTHALTVNTIVAVLFASLVVGLSVALWVGANIGNAVRDLTQRMQRLA